MIDTCEHKSFNAKVSVNRIEDIGRYTADVQISCKDCNQPFRFIGCDAGTSYKKPMVSVDGLELRVPIEPEDIKKISLQATFQVTP